MSAPASRAQVTKVVATLHELDVRHRAERIYVMGVLGGREVTSTNDLTKAEASRIIDTLSRCTTNAELQAVVHHTASHLERASA